MKLRHKKKIAAEQKHQKLVARMYTSMDDTERELDLVDKALDVEERKLDILLKRQELKQGI